MKTTHTSQKGFSLIELLIVVAIIAIIAAIAIPYLFSARQTARGATAVAALRLIHQSQVSYKSANGVYGNLAQLTNANYINDSALSAGQKLDYSYSVTPDTVTPSSSYISLATPISLPTTRRHFYCDATGMIRFHQGSTASSTDEPVD
jgi:type IV pilus assembly protein PilE